MAESQEGLWMSAKERDRLKVLHEVRKRHITQKQAGGELGLSVRWVRTLPKRLRREGDRGLRHRLRGRASNRLHRYRRRRGPSPARTIQGRYILASRRGVGRRGRAMIAKRSQPLADLYPNG